MKKGIVAALIIACGFVLGVSSSLIFKKPSGSFSSIQIRPEDQELYEYLEKLKATLDPDSPEARRVAERMLKLERRGAEAKTDEPNKFAQFLYEMRVPYGAETDAYPANYKMIEMDKAMRNSPQSPQLLDWIERGPGNIPGRTRGLVVDPDDPNRNTWFVGTVGGGIWKTTNGGGTWTELTRNMPNLAVSVVVQSPSNPDIMYAGTGESFYNVDVINGDGILKSTNRGQTWFQLASTAGSDNFNNVSRMIVDPSNPNIILASTSSGRYKINTVNKSGIFKSTNGGTTWYEVYNETEIGQAGRIKRVLQLVYSPGNFNVQYAAVREKGVLKSTNAGETWFLSSTGINDLSGRYELAIAASNPSRIYAAAEGTPNTNLYVSTNAGATWRLTTVSGTNVNWLSSQGWYDNTIVVHPTNQNKVYVGGVYLYAITMISDTVRTITSMSTGQVHVDHHNLVIIPKPGGSFRILNSNDGGLGISTDSSIGWTNPGLGLITSQFYGVDKKPGASAYFGGMQDNNTWFSPDNPAVSTFWTYCIGGDGYETSWHFDNPFMMIGGSQYNGLARSTDGGFSFSSATSGLATGAGNAPFITKIAKTNMEPDLLFAVGALGVYKSTDFGASWGLTAIPSGTWGSLSSFHNVKVSRANPNIVWAGARMDPSGRIHLSTNRGATFAAVPNYAVTTLGGISGIATHPLRDSTAYVLFGFAQKPKIIRTTDLGLTWVDISGFNAGPVSTNGFPDVAVYDLVVLPHTPNVIWAGTEIGLFESTNSGTDWHFANNGLPAASIWAMTNVEEEVVVATHGRGVWSVNIPGLFGGQTFKPLLGNVGQGPDGLLAVHVTLRGLYDSTIVAINDTPFVRLGSNLTSPKDTTLYYSVMATRTISVSAKGYKGGVLYPSLSRSVAVWTMVPARTYYASNFDAGNPDFTGAGFTVSTPAGFANNAVHTSHPYSNGSNISYLLTIPITVAAANAYVAYDDIAIVEPGEPGVPFGDPNFYDYVVVEGTRDGINWLPLADGYDARYDSTWLAAYNSSTPGSASMYRHHELDLHSRFSPGENVLVRFRLYADGYVTGWGWAIDNLEIQQVIWNQQGSKLVGAGASGTARQGYSVAISSDGTTAAIGGPYDNSMVGAVWVYTRSGGVWSQQGSKLVGTGAAGVARQGNSVALSGDGNTLLVGGPGDNSSYGAAWVFTRSGGVWSQQGTKLVGTGGSSSNMGSAISLSSDGNTAALGGQYDLGGVGAVWVFTRTGGIWSQQGSKLVGTGAVGNASQGASVSVSSDGNTLISGGPSDHVGPNPIGAAWVFIRSGSVWSQEGSKLVGTGVLGSQIRQGYSVSLSSDGNTAIVGGINDNSDMGASWVYTRTGGVWSQQGSKLVGTGVTGSWAYQGASVSLSSDGNSAIVGGYGDNTNIGATWVFVRSSGVWSQKGSKLVGTGAVSGPYYVFQGVSVSLSGAGSTAIVGGYADNSYVGAAWIFELVNPQPFFSIAPSMLSFGEVAVGSNKIDSVTVTNTGQLQLTIGSVTSSNPEFVVSPSSGTVAPAASQKFYVTFGPTTSGVSNGSIVFTHDATGSPDTVMVSGTGSASINVALASGWNLISNPVTNPIPGDSVLQLFPTSVNPYAFEFNGGYVQRYALANGKGYWEKFPGAVSQPINGSPRTRDSIGVVAGWNIVGTISSIVDTSTIVSVPPGLRGSTWFGYAAGYSPVTQLVPGFGYWVKANAAGQFVLASGPVLAKSTRKTENPLDALNILTIADSKGGSQTLYFGANAAQKVKVSEYDMPPLPPTGSFDARFETSDGGSMVKVHAAALKEQAEFPVQVRSDAYPLTVSWKVSKGTALYELTDGIGGKMFQSKAMTGEGSLQIMNNSLTKLIVRLVGDGQVPKEFALAQNYPNPFNPSTTIKYDLPKDSRVSLKLFNILGQEIVTLVNEEQKAGYKSVEWNASNFASGVYFYRLEAGSFTSVKKLLLLR